MDKAIERITDGCHHCASLIKCPHGTVEQSTTPSPETVGVSFAADVIKRNRQLCICMSYLLKFSCISKQFKLNLSYRKVSICFCKTMDKITRMYSMTEMFIYIYTVKFSSTKCQKSA